MYNIVPSWDIEGRELASTDISDYPFITKVKQLTKGNNADINRKSHALSDSDIEDISSESEFDNSDEEQHKSDESEENKTGKADTVEVSDKMKLLQQLEKELEKAEAVSENVNEKVSKIVNLGIRSTIDRKKAKELYEKYDRPENCVALVVPKINKELWNTSSLAKTIKDEDKEYQTAQRYLNQGMIPLCGVHTNPDSTPI